MRLGIFKNKIVIDIYRLSDSGTRTIFGIFVMSDKIDD